MKTVKKLTAILLPVIMAFGVFASVLISAGAVESITEETGETIYAYGNYRYRLLDDGTAEITSYATSDTKLDIPSKIKNYTVTGIGEGAFSQPYACTNLTTVVIPDSVKYIGDYAFGALSKLTSITIPNTVKSIGSRVFEGCASLSDITLPVWITSIGDSVFYNCDALTSITIPDGVTSIGDSAFYDCDGLTSITIPDGVTSIGDSAFYDCDGLTSVTIPDGVASIGDSAFYDCDNLTSVTISDSVASIGNNAFSSTPWYENQPDGLVYAGKVVYKYKGDMPGNTSIILKDDTKEIADYAFEHCTSLISITIPDSVTSIGSYSFYSCTGLESIAVPDSVTRIGESAFEECTALAEITIGDGLVSIGKSAFYHTLWYDNQPNGAVVYAGKVAYCHKGNTTEDFSIALKDGTKGISDWAFFCETDLVSITIPDSVVNIGDCAFSCCFSLTSVTIPDGITKIGDYVFESCGFTSIEIPDSVLSIGDKAFWGCDLESVVIGSNVESIGDKAFYGCTDLASVTIPESVTSIGEEALGYWNDNGESGKIDGFTIYGYSGTAAETYANENGFTFVSLGERTEPATTEPTPTEEETTDNNKETVVGEIYIPGGIENVENGEYEDCTGLTGVTFLDGVKSIGDSAFKGCTSLGEVTIGNDVANIGDYAFYNCGVLTSVTIPDNVANIGDKAFGYAVNEDGEEIKVENFTICGYTGTAAETYASENGFTFIALDEVAEPTEPSETDPDTAMSGDVNGDGEITVDDATLVQKAAANIITFADEQISAADVNGDGEVTVDDATLIQKYAAGISAAFPAEA